MVPRSPHKIVSLRSYTQLNFPKKGLVGLLLSISQNFQMSGTVLQWFLGP